MDYASTIRILRYLFVTVFIRIKINQLDLEKMPPILVYNMGKVGSTTVYKSLKKLKLSSPIYYVHFLSEQGITNLKKMYNDLGQRFIPHIKVCELFRRRLCKCTSVKWKIITLVREPISWIISSFFQNIDLLNPDLVRKNGQVKRKQVINLLTDKLVHYDPSKGYIENWFDKEMKATCNIDVYDYPFDHKKGFLLLSAKNAKILILRMEDLNRNFNKALKAFLSIDRSITMIKSNITVVKSYSEAYQYVKQHIVIPEEACRRIYNSKYSSHFYDAKMKEGFITQWSRKNEKLSKKMI